MIRFDSTQVLYGFLFAFIGTALFSLKSIFIKLAFAQGLNTDSVLMLRMAISLPIYVSILFYLLFNNNKYQKSIKSNLPFIIFLGFIGYALSSWLNLKGLENISVSLERLTLLTYPIFVAILGAIFFKTPLTLKTAISLILTYSGIWLIFNQELTINDNTIVGTLFVVCAALSFSFYVLFAKKIINDIGAMFFTVLAMTVSSVLVLLYYSIYLDWHLLTINYEAWIWVFLLAVFSTVIPSFMISMAIAKIGSSKTTIVGTLGPIIAIGVASLALNEPFTLYHIIAMFLVIIGAMLLVLKKQ